jgi:N-acetylneuraminic acid mutarotase
MPRRESKMILGLLAAMTAVFIVAALAATNVINLPGHLKESLGLASETPNPPCHHGMYRKDPKSPPAPAGHWRHEPRSPRAQVEGSAVAIGPIIYTTNGSAPADLRTVLAYDTRSHRWSEPTRTPTGLNHSEAATYHGDLYLAGGYLNGEEPTNNFWQYDPRTKQWTELPPMHQPRAAGGTVVIGDKLYDAGGAPQTFGVSSPVTPYGTLEIYDFKTKTWSFGPDMPDPRHHVASAQLGGKMYVAGGRDATDHSSNEFDRYDPETEEWERLPHLPLGAATMGMVAADGKIVIAGGEDQVNWENGGGWVTPTAWAFDPAKNSWQRLPDMNMERRAHGLAVTGGRIYALMGSYCPGIKPNGPVGTHTVESLPVSALNRN